MLQHGVVLWSMLVESVFDEDGEKHHPNAAPPPSIGIILSRLPQLISILQNPPAMDPIETTSGTLDPPLGETRLKIVEFLASLFHVRSTDIEQELIKCNSIGVVLVCCWMTLLARVHIYPLTSLVESGSLLPIRVQQYAPFPSVAHY